MRRILAAGLLATTVLLTGCGDGEPAPAATTGARRVDATAAVDLIDQGYTVIDVRTPQEFAGGHVKGAKNIDAQAGDFLDQVGALDKGGKYVLYCQSGNRSAQALEKMKRLGFAEVVDAGGFAALKDAGAPVE